MPKIIKTKRVKKKNEIIDLNPIAAFLLSALKGYVLSIILLLLLSSLIFKGTQFTTLFIILIYLSVSLGGFVSGYSAASNINGRGYINGLISASVFSAFILISNAVLLKFNISTYIFIPLLSSVFMGLIGGIVSVNKKK